MLLSSLIQPSSPSNVNHPLVCILIYSTKVNLIVFIYFLFRMYIHIFLFTLYSESFGTVLKTSIAIKSIRPQCTGVKFFIQLKLLRNHKAFFIIHWLRVRSRAAFRTSLRNSELQVKFVAISPPNIKLTNQQSSIRDKGQWSIP